MLGGSEAGFVYQRDGHPNAAVLAESCRQLHQAEEAIVAGTGMGALAIALLSQLQAGDHVIVSRRVYGKSITLFQREGSRLGIQTSIVETTDLAATAAAFQANTRMLLVETIANPLLEVADIAALAKLTHDRGALLLVDNTFASPVVCQPLKLGADLVMESLTKMMNGHSDVVLGLLVGRTNCWERVPAVTSAWGLTSHPFDCWLASRGLMTLAVRMERACANALRVATDLQSQAAISRVCYPGLASDPGHDLAVKQFRGGLCGSIVTFELAGGRAAADAFIAAVGEQIPFCPSLGELSTTLSHPETTSHRGLSATERAALGITGGTIRLSVGIESPEFLLTAIHRGLAALVSFDQ
jgi:cystathionine beta-lyase/cystathionine gamma-synthase